MKKLFIIRGIPGSGKTTKAHSLTPHVFEADDYFTDSYGNYNYDAQFISDAHFQCQQRVLRAMQEEKTPIAVSNTFIRHSEYKIYQVFASEFGYDVDIVICKGRYENVHGVPNEVVKKMLKRFEY